MYWQAKAFGDCHSNTVSVALIFPLTHLKFVGNMQISERRYVQEIVKNDFKSKQHPLRNY